MWPGVTLVTYMVIKIFIDFNWYKILKVLSFVWVLDYDYQDQIALIVKNNGSHKS